MMSTTQLTMDLETTLHERRAVKHYDPNHVMSDEELNKLISLAMLSPTSFNIQNWRFVCVRNPELRQQIREASWNQAQVTDASVVILLCADLHAWKKDPGRYWKNAPEETQQMLVPMIGSFYDGKDQLQRDEAMRSCGIAGQTIMLAAKAMGYDSCPMIGFDPEQVARLIQLPEDHVIGFMITVGKRTQDAHPRGGQLPLEDVLIHNHF